MDAGPDEFRLRVPESMVLKSPTIGDTGHMSNRVPGRLLTPGEVARLFRVDPRTVRRWAMTGKIESIRTPGGHYRYHEAQIRELLDDQDDE